MNELRLAFADKRSTFGPGNFFQGFSLHLERRGIAYVILHGYESPPEHIGSDVDYGVVEEDLPKIAPLLATLPRTYRRLVSENRSRSARVCSQPQPI
jgi:hypothetical protein